MARHSGDWILALDQGGQSSRALVFDETGSVVQAARRAVGVQRAGDDRVEQDPAEIAESLRSVAWEAVGALGSDRSRIRAAGLATQRASLVCWTRGTGEALSPVLGWQDRRAARWLAGFEGSAARVREITGLFLSPHYGASKMRWCLDELPAVRAAQARGALACGPLASYLVAALVGGHPLVADPANASRTLLYDAERRAWSPELLALFDIPAEILPRCVPTVGAFGDLTIGDLSVPLAAVNGDQPSALFADGSPASGAVYANLGTGAFLQRVAAAIAGEHDRLLASIALDDGAAVTRVIEGTVNGAAAALDLCAGAAGSPAPADLDRWLDEVESPPLFLNGVGGLGSPHWVADFPSRWIGAGDAPARAVAVLESIVFLICDNLEAMRRGLPPVAELRLSGGLAQSDGLCRRLAALAGVSVRRASVAEATARGIAWLAVRPREWRPDGAGTLFPPAPLPAFAERYGAWRVELARALAERRRA
ncbi:MAG: hypothetical protein L0Z55_01585 [Planctomycetes bacterium]|nr:hypothetical protein [Planctomycetota bacterium]